MTRIGLVALLCLALAGCGTLQKKLAKASAEEAVASAATDLPALPAECHEDVPHAPRHVGQDAPVALRAERGRTDEANASKRRCVAVYDSVRRAHGPH